MSLFGSLPCEYKFNGLLAAHVCVCVCVTIRRKSRVNASATENKATSYRAYLFTDALFQDRDRGTARLQRAENFLSPVVGNLETFPIETQTAVDAGCQVRTHGSSSQPSVLYEFVNRLAVLSTPPTCPSPHRIVTKSSNDPLRKAEDTE